MVHNEPGIGFDPKFKPEPGKSYRQKVVKSAISEGAFLVQDIKKPDARTKTGTRIIGTQYPPGHEPTGHKNLPEEDLIGTKSTRRLHVTDEQIERTREEMYRDLMAPEIKPAAELLKDGFAKWLTESGDLNTLTDQDIRSLQEALNLLIDGTNTRGYVGAADLGSADRVRKSARQLVEQTSGHISTMNPLTTNGHEDGFSLHMIFDNNGLLKFKDTGIGLLASMERGAVTAERQDVFESNGASAKDCFPALIENYDELIYLSEKMSTFSRDGSTKNGFAKPENIRSLLRGHATRQNYPVRRVIPGGLEWIEAPLDIDCLLDRFTHARLLSGVLAAFREATGKNTPIRYFDEKEGVRDALLARWRRTSADIDKNTLKRFDEKYAWFLKSATELVNAQDNDKGLEVDSRVRAEHKKYFNMRPYSGLPAQPPTR